MKRVLIVLLVSLVVVLVTAAGALAVPKDIPPKHPGCGPNGTGIPALLKHVDCPDIILK